MPKRIAPILKILTVLTLASALGACAWVPLLGKKDGSAGEKPAASSDSPVANASDSAITSTDDSAATGSHDNAKSSAPAKTDSSTADSKTTPAAPSPDVTVKASAAPTVSPTGQRIVAIIPMDGAPTQTLPADAQAATAAPPTAIPAKRSAQPKPTAKPARATAKSRRTAATQTNKRNQKNQKKSQRAAPSKDLWGRIRGRMALADLNHPRISEYTERLKRNPGYINLFVQRAQPYLHYLVDSIDRSDLPLDLIVVPMVESAFKPTAVSPKDAAGLWQIIPSTGREHGLTLAEGYDGRMDIHTSTDAALRYLRYLHKLFKGDWLLALAAYNAGPGAVQNAIRTRPVEPPPAPVVPPPETNPILVATLGPVRLENLVQPIPPPAEPSEPQSLFWSLKLPKETQDYVPRIVALAHIIANPKLYGVKLQNIANQPYLYRVELNPEHKIFDSVTAAGISNDDFLRFNPGFKPGVEPPTQSYKVLLPREQAESLATNTPGARLIAPVKYTVQKGETLNVIAKRHGVSPQTLAKWNGINPKRGLRAGQQITIYPASS